MKTPDEETTMNVALIRHSKLSSQKMNFLKEGIESEFPHQLDVEILSPTAISTDRKVDWLCEKYDIIVLPLTLADGRSLHVAETVHNYCPGVKLLLMSNTDAPTHVITRLFDAHIRPDASLQELNAAMRQLLRKRPVRLTGNKLLQRVEDMKQAASVFKDVPTHRHHPHLLQTPPTLREKRSLLHLSDLHLGTRAEARLYRTELEADLRQRLHISRIDYLVLSGDIADQAHPEQYEAAVEMVTGIMHRFEIPSQNVIVVPGNHDVNWDLSAASYAYVPPHQMKGAANDAYIALGTAGALRRDEALYQKRFQPFDEHFYRKICGSDYPAGYGDQAVFRFFPEERILFLALNSAWKLDHYYRQRIGLHTDALTEALHTLLGGDYADWIKIAVWHHPHLGVEAIDNPGILEQLVVNGFQIFLHGHIHEAQRETYIQIPQRRLHVIGAGTFGAPSNQLVSGIPYQYNLLEFDLARNQLKVNTRRKQSAVSAWHPDARWGDPPRAYYTINLRPR